MKPVTYGEPNVKTIPLRNSDHVTVVDDEDYALLSQFQWSLDKDGYVVCTMRMTMHRMILNEGDEIDHCDLDKCNNVRSNLRPATTAQNQWNRNKPSDNTSGFKGVSWYAPSGKWVARIAVNRKRHHLGYFATPEAAARAYDAAALQYHGEFARTNKDAGNY